MGATAVATLCAYALLPAASQAQTAGLDASDLPQGAQMLLTADNLIYDNDNNTITAAGGVQIEYNGHTLVADQVTYDRATSRVMASGRVQIVQKDGNRIFADEIDITDNFSDGFVNALRVETVDKTYFAAESAERSGGRLTTFNNGVYTACEPCREKPEKPPIWRIKAQKIIWNGEAKTVRFESARFEFFGMPIAYLPFLEVADPTVKRKSGFLLPSITYKKELGAGVKVPYYLALSPTYDLTVSGTYYTKQGFLAEAEWRQRFDNGQYSVTVAGIRQQEPEAWKANTVNGSEKTRGMIGTKGQFQINPRWTFGWDVLAQTDKNFSRTYKIGGFADTVQKSELYLTGLDDRNFFDLRAMHFNIQEDAPTGRDEQQPWVLPSFDYSFTPDEPVAGGELNFDVNMQGLRRETLSLRTPGGFSKLDGAEGSSGRLTAEAEWKRSFVTDGGLVVTPLLQARGDAVYTDYDATTINGITNFTTDSGAVGNEIRSSYYRYMATAGLEARWPILFSTSSASHVLEPMAQVFIRPDAPYQGKLGVPNEDAQSLVFDATTLFERDKFSGFDRIEGGTRANVGIRYSGSFANGWTAHGLFGQSYHLAGANPYAQPDLVNVGAYSGLETDVSDFVGMVGFATPGGLALSAAARFDEKTFEIRRTDIKSAASIGNVTASLQYAFIQAQPLYGFLDDRQEVTGVAKVRFDENWSGFGSGTYDLESRTLVSNSYGVSYGDDCFIYSMTYTRSKNRDTQETSQSFGFRIALRTIGDFGTSSGELDSSF
ncbi:LPS-assembly protein LptD [Nitratireductor pacificus]|uniref:LPS-assembly protein LptD n=1 Tax=Nitratireductor pacificus pht-3B TaxID=391937 RepID=K2MSH6_9HYPH|nr:LPS-assembly protein LptD [Nitratireductor pacificus]EKF20327.1 organic solvent tolerance protein [Nitratireductor pacificus pht-3B]